jgi:hypothetical protein
MDYLRGNSGGKCRNEIDVGDELRKNSIRKKNGSAP